MNWDAVGAVAELIAAVGVIVSLLYLAIQVRQSTMVARRTAAHELLDTASPLLFAIAENPDVASIWARGLADFESLDELERIRFSTLLLNLTYSWEESWNAMQSGQIDDWAFQRLTASRHELARLPGFRAWFAVRKHWLGDDFRRIIEEDLREGEVSTPLYRTAARDAAGTPGSVSPDATTA